jgi:tol-pal system protein YbgF
MKRVALFLTLTLSLGWASWCSAGLFSDDEAHKKIEALQKQVQAMEERVAQMENAAKAQGVGLLTQMEALKSDLAALRGQVEVHTHDIETTQKRQRDLYVDLDSRLRKLERVGGAAEGQAEPTKSEASQPAAAAAEAVGDETKAYDAALALFKAGNYQGAITGFRDFANAHPNSNLAPSAYYWIGNSYFNLRDYKNAIANQQKLVSAYPSSPKVPDALLNIASCQQGLGEASAARKTLENIVAKFPLSNAAELAKKRLAHTSK